MSTYYLINIYKPIVDDAYIKPSTSAEGWKYHKPNKKRKRK